jgi:hypothetical protein
MTSLRFVVAGLTLVLMTTCGGTEGPPGEPGAPAAASGSRLKILQYSGDDGSSFTQVGQFHDSMLNVDCSSQIAADGVQRCLPSSIAQAGSYFSDSGCSQPVAFSTPAGCSAPAYAVNYLVQCSGVAFHVFPVTGVYGGSLYEGSPTSCSSTTKVSGWTYYDLGAEVPAANFVKFTVQ